MVTDHAVSTGSARGSHAGNGLRRRPLVLTAFLAAVVGFLGWIAVLALTLPTRYPANHWNVAWVGFDVMLLLSLLTTGWSLVTRRPWAGSALMVSAALLSCDAWFDVTTATGATATVASLGAAALELPVAAGLAWAAVRLPLRDRARVASLPVADRAEPRAATLAPAGVLRIPVRSTGRPGPPVRAPGSAGVRRYGAGGLVNPAQPPVAATMALGHAAGQEVSAGRMSSSRAGAAFRDGVMRVYGVEVPAGHRAVGPVPPPLTDR